VRSASTFSTLVLIKIYHASTSRMSNIFLRPCSPPATLLFAIMLYTSRRSSHKYVAACSTAGAALVGPWLTSSNAFRTPPLTACSMICENASADRSLPDVPRVHKPKASRSAFVDTARSTQGHDNSFAFTRPISPADCGGGKVLTFRPHFGHKNRFPCWSGRLQSATE